MKKIVIILLAAVIFTSCNKFLDYQPDDRTDLNSEVKIKELVASAYPKAHYVAFAESMSDNAGDKATTDRIEQNFVPWRFEDQVKSEYDMPNTYWHACYAAIAAANHALEAIEELGNPESLNPTKGEALVARAYSHFMLALFFAKPYGPTSSSDLGIPYVTEPEKIAQPQYSRGTVASVYTNIEQDLLTGIALIDNSSYSRPSFHFNRNAAYTFATRFFLFKKDYEKVIQYADLVAKTDVISGTLRPWNTSYEDWSYYVIQDAYGNSTTPANLLLVEANSIWGGDYSSYNYGLNSSLLAEVYGATSNPLGVTLSFRSKVFGGTEVVYNIPKFKTSMIKESISDNFGEPWVVYSLFAIEEVLFNRAEAYANLGRVEDAINELNVFLSKRITGYNAANPNHKLTPQKLSSFYPDLSEKDAAIEASLNFKRQEFLFEGMRWFDIIRTGKTVTHTSVRGSGENYNIIVNANDNRRVLQLPQEAIQSGLEANPR